MVKHKFFEGTGNSENKQNIKYKQTISTINNNYIYRKNIYNNYHKDV